MAMAIYLLGFNTYSGFADNAEDLGVDSTEGMLKRLYRYAKAISK